MVIGSEYHLDLSNLKISEKSIFQYIGSMEYRLFDSGRSALKAAVRAVRGGSVLMPEYMCKSVLTCFPAEQIIFYRLKDHLQIDIRDLSKKINSRTSVVYLMHYFGSLQPDDVLSFLRAEKEKYGFTIIEDTTHSIFSSKQTVGDCCIASLRKWFAVPNGGILYSNHLLMPDSDNDSKENSDNEKAYAMILKTLFLQGRLNCEDEYRKIFSECEKKFDRQEKIGKISDLSNFLLHCNNICSLKKKRESNFSFLKSGLNDIGISQICDFTEKNCPFALPIMVPDRNDFRQYLMEHKIYCAVHWAFDGTAYGERPLARHLSETELSLPIDQRYGEKEMAYLIEVIGSYKGRLK